MIILNRKLCKLFFIRGMELRNRNTNGRPNLVLEEEYDENYQPNEEGMSHLYKRILNYNTRYFVSIYKYDIDI